jgi:hypothetical protein
MPSNVPSKIAFLNGEITGLRTRIGTAGNAVQLEKLAMLTDIRDDYQKSVDAVAERAAEKQEKAAS